MNNALTHLHPSLENILSQSIDEKIQFVQKSKWIGYPKAHDILNKLEDLLSYPEQPRMPNMLIVGNSNNGKTHLINHFTKKHLADENVYGEHIIAPVIYCEAPPTPNEGAFYSEILHMLYERIPSSSVDAKKHRVIEVLSNIQTKILIIDELHNMLAGSSTKQQNFLNMIKHLSNKLQISIVGCGTPDLIRAISIDPQIQNRFIPEVLPNWSYNTQFKKLLASYESVIPLPEASNLANDKMSLKLHAVTDGLIGELNQCLTMAAIYCIKQGETKIDSNTIDKCGYRQPQQRSKLPIHI